MEKINHKILKNYKNVLVVNSDNPRARAVIELFEKGNWRIFTVGPTDIPLLRLKEFQGTNQKPTGVNHSESALDNQDPNKSSQKPAENTSTEKSTSDPQAAKEESSDLSKGNMVHFQSMTEEEILNHHSLMWDKFPEQLAQDVDEAIRNQKIKFDAVLVFNEDGLLVEPRTPTVNSFSY